MRKQVLAICDNCGKEYYVDKRVFNNTEKHNGKHFCCKKCQFEAQKNGKFVKCLNCGKEIYITGKQLRQKNHYCSQKCTHQHINHSHLFSEETKQKIRESVKKSIQTSEKFITLQKQKKEQRIIKECPICHNKFEVRPCESDKTYCSRQCYNNDHNMNFRKKGNTGGKRHGSGRGKKGWYKGYYCDSSWELAYVVYNIEHEIQFERNTDGFEYVFEGKKHKYYPDFKMPNGSYVEIKGAMTKQNKVKINSFNGLLIVLGKEEIKPYLEYVIQKYGKDYIKLYDFFGKQ